MSSQVVPIQRTNNNSTTSNSNKTDVGFDAFNFAAGQDKNIRWLSRPNQQLVQEKSYQDAEKFRITFDAENFQPEQIKIYIQNHKLTLNGVYEERSEGRFMQKQFEKSFDIPNHADVEAMASYITPAHMLVVEIPINPNLQQQQSIPVDHLNVNNNLNDQRRLSFSLNKFNTLNNQGLLSASNNLSNLPTPGQQLRRTSITKTTTTTTSTGSTGLTPEATELLRNTDTSTSGTHTYSTRVTERRGSNTGNQQIIINEPSASSSTNSSSTLTNADLANLPIEIPPELLATGGTITIQKRKVSVTKTTDPNAAHPISVPITNNNNPQSTSSTNTSAQTNINERRGSKTMSTTNQQRMYTLEEFLQNKTWNPSIIDGTNGKKILSMRLSIPPGTIANQIKIILNGFDLRVEIENKSSADVGRVINEHNYRQVTLFPTCEVAQLKTELKDDGFLHIQVPIKL